VQARRATSYQLSELFLMRDVAMVIDRVQLVDKMAVGRKAHSFSRSKLNRTDSDCGCTDLSSFRLRHEYSTSTMRYRLFLCRASLRNSSASPSLLFPACGHHSRTLNVNVQPGVLAVRQRRSQLVISAPRSAKVIYIIYKSCRALCGVQTSHHPQIPTSSPISFIHGGASFAYSYHRRGQVR
jgi:hypothetical protein